jgi:HEPN domain-containing protein
MRDNRDRNKSNFSVWLQFAEEDFLSAKLLLERKIYNQVCFHSQQVAEKNSESIFKISRDASAKSP